MWKSSLAASGREEVMTHWPSQFKKKVPAGWLGETVADVDYTTNTKVQSSFPECGVPPQTIFAELTYLDAFIFEQATGTLFAGQPIHKKMLEAFVSRLVHRNLKTPLETFLSESDKRRLSYEVSWSTPPDHNTFMGVAAQAVMRCGTTNYLLLIFFFTHATTSYRGTLDLLNDRNAKYKIV